MVKFVKRIARAGPLGRQAAHPPGRPGMETSAGAINHRFTATLLLIWPGLRAGAPSRRRETRWSEVHMGQVRLVSSWSDYPPGGNINKDADQAHLVVKN